MTQSRFSGQDVVRFSRFCALRANVCGGGPAVYDDLLGRRRRGLRWRRCCFSAR